jgi:hypothetical protein
VCVGFQGGFSRLALPAEFRQSYGVWPHPRLAQRFGAYFGAVVAALCISALYSPSLPIVTIQSDIGEAPDCSTSLDRTFVMLDETPGYWHVYNKTGLYSLNESEVESVRYQNCQEREIRP